MNTGSLLGISAVLLFILVEFVIHNKIQRRIADALENIHKAITEEI